ncbi:MAG: hypothetical protein JSU00_18315 [Acidobacteria bacterium]|nr:hypothetical protein [Acidobacteriota bacterium]
MRHLPTSDRERLESELSRLYERRLIVDELIQVLERYAASASAAVSVPNCDRFQESQGTFAQ